MIKTYIGIYIKRKIPFLIFLKLFRIVTGVRLQKKDRLFYLQIQQGVLGPGCSVNPNTVSWREIFENYTDSDYLDLEKNYSRDAGFNQGPNQTHPGMRLNRVSGQPGQVVTGVRFSLFNGHLGLELRMSAFDYESGNLTGETYEYHMDTRSTSEVVLTNPDIPTAVTGQEIIINRRADQHIHFQPSGRLADAAQTIVPYLDVQEVVTNPPTPLSGIGLYHKAATGTGGFIAPLVTTYDKYN